MAEPGTHGRTCYAAQSWRKPYVRDQTGNTWQRSYRKHMAEHVMRPNPGKIHLSEIRPETRGSDHTVYSNHVPDEGR